MYKGTLSSFIDNTFRYNIKTKEFPCGLMMPIRCETFVFFNDGKKSISLEIDTEDELIFVKSNRVNMILEIPCKVKFTLENVTIKRDGKEYKMSFSSVSYNQNL